MKILIDQFQNKHKTSNNQKVREKGLLIILSSPSGVGKSTLAQRIKSWDKIAYFQFQRQPGNLKGEQDGKDYYLFLERISQKRLIAKC